MELAKIVGSTALILGVVLVAGHAAGEDATESPARTAAAVAPRKVADREGDRRAAVVEQQKRKQQVSRLCGKPVKTDAEMEACRLAYRRL